MLQLPALRALLAAAVVSLVAVTSAVAAPTAQAAPQLPAAQVPAGQVPAVQSPEVRTPAAAPAPAVVQCYGDSMLDALCRPAPQALGATMPGVELHNFAIGGMTSTSIAIAAGLHQLSLSRPAVIPASGFVELAEPIGLVESAQLTGRVVMRASINGVEGLLNHRPDLSQPWRFEREGQGAAVAVPVGTPIQSLQRPRAGAASIVWAGTNNLERPDRVLQDVAAIVEAHQSVSDAPIWVVSVTPAWSDRWSERGRNRIEINAQLERWYGQRYIPLDEYLANGALYEAGIEPTRADRDAVEQGFNPRSFWLNESDLTHLNFPGQMAAARLLDRFITKGATLDSVRARFDAISTMDAAVSGASVTVSGWAADHSDLFRSIQVGVTIDGRWMGATLADLPSDHLFAYGIPGRHGYSWRFDGLSPGEHLICSVAVGFGAGEDHFPPCRTVTVAARQQTTSADAASGSASASAPASAPATRAYEWTLEEADRSLAVAVQLDGRWHTAVRVDAAAAAGSGESTVWAALPRP